MIRLATLQVLLTSILLSSNNHPIILVHGFLGWGKEEVCDKKSWMKASRKLHPDKEGDADKFRDMNECYKQNKDNLSCS